LLRRYAEQQAKVSTPRSEERIVHFPKDKSIGRCFLVEPQPEQTCLWHRVLVWPKTNVGHVRGDVTVPAGKILRLDVWDGGPRAHKALARLGPDDVQILNFYQCKRADDRMLAAASRMTGLKVLFLGQGRFTLKGLKHLTAFRELRALQLPADVPVESLELIRKVKSLRYLCVTGPELTDAKMAKIGELPWLTQLGIAPRDRSEGLRHIAKLKSLRHLFLPAVRDPRFDRHLAYISDLTELEEIDFKDSMIGDAGLVHLRKMKKLKKLDLFSNPVTGRITDAGMVHLKALKSLEELRLTYGFTDVGIEHLATLDSLKKVNLWGDGITDKSMGTLAEMKSLEQLDLASLSITDEGMLKLSACHCLESLTLDKCQITDAGLADLAKLKTLSKLTLGRTQITGLGRTQVTGRGLAVLKELPLLKELNVNYVDFGEAGMAHLAGLKSLERLSISMPKGKITDDDLADLSRVTSLKICHV
jgi:Leucine-rich repeat (LRR) protein